MPFVVIEKNHDHLETAWDLGYLFLSGDAGEDAILEKVAHNWPFFLTLSVPHKLGYTTSKRTKETNRFQLCPAVLTVG